jgi:hypothetical protein
VIHVLLKAISIAFFLFARVCGRLTMTMKPHPRIRKTIKWGGAAVTVLLVVLWIAGGWWKAEFRLSAEITVHNYDGCLGVPVGGWGLLGAGNFGSCFEYYHDSAQGFK